VRISISDLLLAIGAIAAGIVLALIDSGPRFDDSGILAGGLFFAAAVVTFAAGRSPWLWTLLVGLWVPLVEIAQGRGAGGIAAFLFSGLGAGAGYLARVGMTWRQPG
jgi:hypothetical protein